MKIVTKQIFIYSGILVIYFVVMVILICVLRNSCCAKTVACQTIMPEVEQPNVSKNFAAPDTCLSGEQEHKGAEAVDSLTCQCAVHEDAKAEIVSQVPCECVEDISYHITIWLGVIGAICTILPVVLGIKQSMDNQQIMNQFREEVEKTKKDVKGEMVKQQKEMDAKLSMQKHLHTISYLDRLLLSVSHLCNIKDIKYKGDMPILSSPIIRPMLESIEDNSKKAYTQYCDIRSKCTSGQKKVIFYAALEALYSIRNLAQIYEDEVDVKTMVQLQSLKDSISVYLKQWNEKIKSLEDKPDYKDHKFREWLEKKKKNMPEPVDPLYEVRLAAQKIHSIIGEELKRREKEKKEKEKKEKEK